MRSGGCHIERDSYHTGIVEPYEEHLAIGTALAVRNLMTDLRSSGEITGGPKPPGPRDRSNFISALDQTIRRLQRRAAERTAAGQG